jgi:hypothetical protein
MQRLVYEKYQVEGFRSQKVDSIAFTPTGRTLFAGSAEGALLIYQFNADSGNSY